MEGDVFVTPSESTGGISRTQRRVKMKRVVCKITCDRQNPSETSCYNHSGAEAAILNPRSAFLPGILDQETFRLTIVVLTSLGTRSEIPGKFQRFLGSGLLMTGRAVVSGSLF